MLHLEKISMKTCSVSGVWETVLTLLVLTQIHRTLCSTWICFSFYGEKPSLSVIPLGLLCCQRDLSNLSPALQTDFETKRPLQALNVVHKIFGT